MKGNLKKTLAIALAAMMSAAALASCGGSDAGSSKADSSTPAPTASDSGEKGVVTLKVLTPESDNPYRSWRNGKTTPSGRPWNSA